MIGCKRAVVVAQEVAHRTTDQEVPGSDPTGRWAFFSLSSLSYLSIRSLVEVQHYWFFNFPRKFIPSHAINR